MLSKNNIEAWLEDADGNEIPNDLPTTSGNEVKAAVEIEGGKAIALLSIPTLPQFSRLRPLASSPWIQAYYGLG